MRLEEILAAKPKLDTNKFLKQLRELYSKRALEHLQLWVQKNEIISEEFHSISLIDEYNQAGYRLVLKLKNPATGKQEYVGFLFHYGFEGIARQMKIAWYGDCYDRNEWPSKIFPELALGTD